MSKAQPSINQFATLFYGGLLVTALVWVCLRTGDWIPESLHAGSVLNSLVAGTGVALIVVVLSELLMQRFRPMRELANLMRSVLGSINSPTAAWLALTSAIGEELFFRGAMQPVFGYIATSILFGIIHVGPDRRYLIWTVFAVAVGFVFGAILLLTGNLLGCILAHGLINFINLRRLGRLQVDVPEQPE